MITGAVECPAVNRGHLDLLGVGPIGHLGGHPRERPLVLPHSDNQADGPVPEACICSRSSWVSVNDAVMIRFATSRSSKSSGSVTE